MKKKTNDIKIKPVTALDARFLYRLLMKRDPIANISHRKMPTYDEHLRFLSSKPYKKWYIVYHNNRKIGSTYLSKQDEIGIFLNKEMHGKGIGSMVMKLIMEKNPRSRYLANVSPKNTKSAEFFRKNGFVLIQHTYELINSD